MNLLKNRMRKQGKTQDEEEEEGVTFEVRDRLASSSVVKMEKETFRPERGKELDFPLAFLEAIQIC